MSRTTALLVLSCAGSPLGIARRFLSVSAICARLNRGSLLESSRGRRSRWAAATCPGPLIAERACLCKPPELFGVVAAAGRRTHSEHLKDPVHRCPAVGAAALHCSRVLHIVHPRDTSAGLHDFRQLPLVLAVEWLNCHPPWLEMHLCLDPVHLSPLLTNLLSHPLFMCSSALSARSAFSDSFLLGEGVDFAEFWILCHRDRQISENML